MGGRPLRAFGLEDQGVLNTVFHRTEGERDSLLEGAHEVSWALGPRAKAADLKEPLQLSEEIIAENSQEQEVQGVPYRINPGRDMPRHIIKLTKIKDKGKILKA